MITRVADNKRAAYSLIAVPPNELQIEVSVDVSRRLYLRSIFRVVAHCEADERPLQALAKVLLLEPTTRPLRHVVEALDSWLQKHKGPQFGEEYERNLQKRDRYLSQLNEFDSRLGGLPTLPLAIEAAEGTETMSALRVWVQSGPHCFCHNMDNQHYLFYRGSVWRSTKTLSNDEWVLLVEQKLKKEQQLLQYLSFGPSEGQLIDSQRKRIPEEVRIEVWRRDSGKCARCGSRTNLEFDHIVPFSKGGSDTARNLELLCQTCNRLKSDSIT